MEEFEMIDLDLLHYFQGLVVKFGEDGIFISQMMYAKVLLKKFCMLRYNSVVTPMNSNEKFVSEAGDGNIDPIMYRSLIGRLIHLTHCRPNLSYSGGIFSRFMERLSNTHLGETKRIMHYISGTISYEIWYSSKGGDSKLYGYSNYDFASCLDDRKSISIYAFTLGSEVIVWS